MFEQRKNIRDFVNRLIEGFPESKNPKWRYISFFKDSINGFAFSAPYLDKRECHGRVILNIPQISNLCKGDGERFASFLLMNLYHETQHTYQFDYMKENKLDIRNCLLKHQEKLEKQAIEAMNNLKYDFDFSYLQFEGKCLLQ